MGLAIVIIGGFLAFVGLLIALVLFLRRTWLERTVGVLGQRIGGVAAKVKVPGRTKLVPGWEAAIAGRQVTVFSRVVGNRDYVVVRVATRPFPLILFRRESRIDRVGRAVRLNREIQTGDRGFDESVYLETDEPYGAVQAFLADPALRASLREVVAGGATVTASAEGLELSRVLVKGAVPTAEELETAVPRLVAIAERAPEVLGARGVRTRARGDLLASAALAGFCVGWVLSALMPVARLDVRAPCFAADRGLVPSMSLLLWLIAVVATYLWVRGHSRSLRYYLTTVIFGFFALILVPGYLANAANAWLDSSPPVEHETIVVDTVERSSRYGTHHIVVFVSWRTHAEAGEADAPRDVWRTLHRNDRVILAAHRGALGWDWVSEVRRAPALEIPGR